ncbi:WecB/TagA/CpsF family glycosyltransferase [Euzebya tangerina]|uniref:WecB/TagA/CpsF family glycosyltransferase n=1 Tax=Euzebya tangerina TaxID=591198 RepID=UPI000E322B38|nr:WecB/TagA/CpsF family glycosyltransferase [Euzebya tangerina]
MTLLPDRTDVVGTTISATSYEEVMDLLLHPLPDRARTVMFCNVHSVMVARRDPELRRAIEAADLATPDGVPLVWTLRRLGHPTQQRVYGPDLMEMALPWGRAHDLRHYLYGGSPETLRALQGRIAALAPGAAVVGAHSPPFRQLTSEEEQQRLAHIRDSGADVVWVGLGMPKQELWMHRVAPELPGTALMGVGAAFDFLAGTVAQAPDVLQRAGLEWLYRLLREPRRLWKRYAVNNPQFLWYVARQLVGRDARTAR